MIELPAAAPLAVNPKRILALKPQGENTKVVVDAGRSEIIHLSLDETAQRLGADFKAVQLADTGGPIKAYLNKTLVSDVVLNVGAPVKVCFVFVAGARYPVNGDLATVLAALA